MSDFEWDPAKAAANLRKHRVDFADAVTAFEDSGSVVIRDPDASGEERFIGLGTAASGSVLVTIFTWRGVTIRIISSRLASRSERARYREQL